VDARYASIFSGCAVWSRWYALGMVRVALAAVAVLLAARPLPGQVTRPARAEDLTFAAEVQSEGRNLRVVAVVSNVAAEAVEIGFGDCSLKVRLYRTADRSGPQVWDSDARGGVCLDFMAIATILPHASVRQDPYLVARVSETDIAALPLGSYYATIIVRLARPTLISREIPAGHVTVKRG